MYNFSYTIPDNFNRRVYQFLQQMSSDAVAKAFNNSSYEYDDVGYAYYAGLKGDNWDKKALDFVIEGTASDIRLLRENGHSLKSAINKSLKSDETGFLIRNITYFDKDADIPETDCPKTNMDRLNADLESANAVYKDLVKVGERLCSNATYNGESPENSINDFIRDGLSLMGYHEVKDQTRHGISLNGGDAGEVDILLTKDGKEIAIYEGLNLDSVNSSYISKHVNKAIVNYNALGTATYLVAYVNSANYEIFWNRYKAYINDYDFPIEKKRDLEVLTFPNAAMRAATMIMSRDGYDFPVYFITLNVRK